MKTTKKITFDFAKHLTFIPIKYGNTESFYKWDGERDLVFEDSGVILLQKPFGVVVEKKKRKEWIEYIARFIEHYNTGFEL